MLKMKPTSRFFYQASQGIFVFACSAVSDSFLACFFILFICMLFYFIDLFIVFVNMFFVL